MANWSAKITEKTGLSTSESVRYSFVILMDDVELPDTFSVEGHPNVVQQLLSQKVQSYGEAYELADALPGVGDILEIVTTD